MQNSISIPGLVLLRSEFTPLCVISGPRKKALFKLDSSTGKFTREHCSSDRFHLPERFPLLVFHRCYAMAEEVSEEVWICPVF